MTAITAPTPNVLVVLEQKIEGFINELVAGVEHEIKVIEQALANTAPLVAAAAAKIASLAPFIEGLGAAAGHPEVIAGVEAANVAMNGLNAFMQTFTQPSVTASQAKTAITNAYQAYRNTVATYNSVKATAVAAAVNPPMPTPSVTAS